MLLHHIIMGGSFNHTEAVYSTLGYCFSNCSFKIAITNLHALAVLQQMMKTYLDPVTSNHKDYGN